MSVVCRLPLLPAGPEMTVASTCAALQRRVHLMYYITLHCTVNHIALHYIALHLIHYIVLHYITLYCISLHCALLHYINDYIVLCCITLHCTALHYTVLHYKYIVLWIMVHYSLSYHSALREKRPLHCTALWSIYWSPSPQNVPVMISRHHHHITIIITMHCIVHCITVHCIALNLSVMISILHYISTSW